ncbi:MAG: hypothetical protein ABIT37_15080 [Luteolibacter sp.]
MKTISTNIRVLFATIAFGALSSFAYAGPGVQHWKTLGNESQFKELKPGMTAAFVCSKCKTISEMPIKSEEQAMTLCKEGGSVVCPSCKMVTKVVIKRERNQAPTHTEVSYVNDKGEDCAFMVVKNDKM